MRIRTRAAVGLVVLALVGSCVGGDGPTSVGNDGTVFVTLQPALIPSPADGSALAVNRVRTLVARAADLAVLREQRFDVSPTATSWTLDVDVPVTGSSADVVLLVYLVNVASDGTESPQFSGRSGTVTVRSGDRVTDVDVTIVRGPLANLDVTGVTITASPTTLAVGARDTLSATATTSGSTPATIYWTSLAPSVLGMSDSIAMGVSAGATQVVASAGAFADTVTVTVTATPGPAPVDSVRVLPDSAVLSVGGSTTYTAATFDDGGNLLTGRLVTWSSGNTSIATVVPSSGLVTAVAPGTTTIRATSEGQFDEGTVRVTVPPAGAATIIWTKGSNGNWSEASSWDLGRVPLPGDTVRLPGTGYTVTLDLDASVGRVVIDAHLALGTRTLTITGTGAGDELDVHPTGILDLANGTILVADVRADGTLRASGGIAQVQAASILMNASANLEIISGGILTLARATGTDFRTSGTVLLGGSSALVLGANTTATYVTGTITGAGGLVFQPGADLVLDGDLTLNGPTVVLTAGTIAAVTTERLIVGPSTTLEMNSTAGAALIAAELEVQGDLHATGPDSRVGDLTVTSTGAVFVDGTGGGVVLATGDVDNQGDIYLSGFGASFGPGAGTGVAIRNRPSGAIQIEPDADGHVLNGELHNEGTITVQSETRLRRLDGGGVHVNAAHTNTGTIEVMTGGRLILQLGGTTPTFTNAGTINVSNATGALVATQVAPATGSFVQSGLGVITGAGTVDLRDVSTATIGGTVAPGAPSTRRLTWLGKLALGGTGTVAVELAGVFPLTGYDQLFVSDTVALAGTLAITSPSFTPAAGNRFAVMTFAARTSSFTAVSFPSLSGVALDTVWAEAGTTDTLYLVASAAAPSSLNRWVNPVSGSWGTASNWSAGTVPATTDSVVIDVPGTYTVTMSVSDTVAALVVGGSSGQQTLDLANNVPLRVTGPSVVGANGRIYLNGGILSGPGTLTNRGNVTAFFGTLNGPLANEGVLVAGGNTAINGALTTTATSVIRLEADGTCCGANLSLTNGFTNNGLVELTSVNAGTGANLLVTGTLLNASGATVLASTGVGGSRSIGGTLDNQGTITANQPLTLSLSGASTNAGTINLNVDVLMNPGGSFTNTGTVTVAATRTLTVGGGTLNQSSGTLGGAGTLALNNVIANFTTAFSTATTGLSLLSTTFNGPGTLTNAPGDTIVASFSTIAAPLVNQGRLRLRGTNEINGTLTTTATSAISVEGDGTYAGALTDISSGFTNLGLIEITTVNAATSAHLFVDGTIVNADSIVSRAGLGGSRTLTAGLSNSGTLLVSQALTLNAGNGASSNSGTVNVAGGDLTWNMSGAGSLTNTSTVTIGAGLTWTVSGTLNQSAGSISGAGTLALLGTTANLTTDFNNATTRLSLNSSTVNGPGTLTNASGDTIVSTFSTIAAPFVNDGLIRLRGTNTISGSLTTSTTSTIRVEGDGNLSAGSTTISGSFTNNGLIEITDVNSPTSASLSVGGTLVNADSIVVGFGMGGGRNLSAVVTNQGTLVVGQTVAWAGGVGTSLNTGTIDVSGGDLTFSSGVFTNENTVTIASGRTFTMSGGTLNQSSGSIGGAGTLSLSGTTANFTTPFSNATTQLVISSTTFNGPGVLTSAAGDTLVVSFSTIAAPLVQLGKLRLRGTNTISGGMTTSATAHLVVEGDGTFSAASTTFSGSFTNNGIIEITAINAATSAGLYLSAGTLTNSSTGAISSTVGAGGPRMFGVGATTLLNQGTIWIYQPLTLSGTLNHADNALLAGTSSLDYSTATIAAFDGDVAPGSSPGVLSLTGSYAPSAASTFRVELNGTGVASGYDRLVVNGAATLNGALVVLDTTAFVPSVGNRYAILTAATLSGNFSSMTLPTVAGVVLDTAWATAGAVDTLFIEATAAIAPIVATFDAARGGIGSLTTGSEMVEARTTLAANFPDLSLTELNTLSGASLAGADALVLGAVFGTFSGFSPLSAGEQAALLSFVTSGGCAVLLADNAQDFLAASQSMLAPFGMSVAGTFGQTTTATVPAPTSNTITNGAFGLVAQFDQVWPAAVTNTGPYGIPLATNVLGNALVVVPQGALGPGSGPVIVFSDLQFTNDLLPTNEDLWLNTIDACVNVGLPPLPLNRWTSAVSGNWNTNANWSRGIAPVPADSVVVDLPGTYTITLDGNGTAGSLHLGAPFGLQLLSIPTTRTLTLSGANQSTIGANGRVVVEGAVNGTASITNAGVTTLIGGTIANPILNQGSLIGSGNASLSGALTTTGTSLIQAGQVNGTQSTAFFTVADGFVNNGTIDITNLTAAAAYASQFTVTNGTLTNSPGASIISTAGTLGGGTRTLSARVDNAGTMSSSTGHPLAWQGPLGAVHTNSGTIDATAANISLSMTGAASLTSSGTITVPAGRTLSIANGTFTLPVGGTLAGGGGLTLSNLSASFATGFTLGSLSATNSTLTIASALNTAAIGLSLAGSTVNGVGSITNASTETLTLNATTVAVPVTNQGTLVASGSSAINGTFTSGAGSTLRVGQVDGSQSMAQLTVASGFTNNGVIELTNLTNAAAYASRLDITSGTLTNPLGRTITTAAGSLGGGTRMLSAALDNQGTLITATGHPLLWFGPNNAVHSNSGTMDATLAPISLTMAGTAQLTNTGSITVGGASALSLIGGAFLHQGSGTFTGLGELFLSGNTTTLSTGLAISGIGATNSTIDLQGGDLSTSSTALSLAGTTINGPGTLVNDGALVFNGGTINAPVTNSGDMTVSGTAAINGALTTANGSTLRIGQIDGSVSQATLTVATGFVNDGAIELTNLTTAAAYASRLNVTTGTLNNSLTGTITTSRGAAATSGTRTIAAPLVNEGIIAVHPGEAGTLGIEGALLNLGTLELELGGLTAGTEYDQIQISGVTGSMGYGGTLDVGTFGGFTPTPGNQFFLLTYLSSLGAGFTPTNLPPLGAGTWGPPGVGGTQFVIQVF